MLNFWLDYTLVSPGYKSHVDMQSVSIVAARMSRDTRLVRQKLHKPLHCGLRNVYV